MAMIHLELNQSRLDTYAKCERRFFLQYLCDQYVPSRSPLLPAEVEERVRQGTLFHQFIERALRGIPIEHLLQIAPEPIDGWVETALDFISRLPTGLRFTEFSLSLPFQEALLTAKYDLLVICEDKAFIIDWKTSGRPRSPSKWQQEIQHIVFPFVLAAAAPRMGWNQIKPDNIEFIYWFAVAPQETSRVPYSSGQHQQNQKFLERQVSAVLAKSNNELNFPQITDTIGNRESFCSQCTFMFHCKRGESPGSALDLSSIFLDADLERFFAAEIDLDDFEIAY